MPEITIHISEQQEAKISDLISKRRDFIVDGGKLTDLDGKQIFLKSITFEFHESAHSERVERAVLED